MLPLITAILPFVDKALGFIPNENDRAKAKEQLTQDLQDNIHELAKAQIGVNQQEAKHKSLFVAGWRPSIGWICGFGFAYVVLIQPIGNAISIAFLNQAIFPFIDTGILLTTMGGMLGLGGLRTYEKKNGLAK